MELLAQWIKGSSSTGSVSLTLLKPRVSYYQLFCENLTLGILSGNERMPTEIGWHRRNTTMQGTERLKYTRLLMEAAGVRRLDVREDAYGRPLFH